MLAPVPSAAFAYPRVVPDVIVVDEGCAGGLQFTFEDVVVEQDAVLQRLMPPFDLALNLGLHRRATKMFDALALEVVRQTLSNTR